MKNNFLGIIRRGWSYDTFFCAALDNCCNLNEELYKMHKYERYLIHFTHQITTTSQKTKIYIVLIDIQDKMSYNVCIQNETTLKQMLKGGNL